MAYKWYTNGIQMIYKWYTNGIQMVPPKNKSNKNKVFHVQIGK